LVGLRNEEEQHALSALGEAIQRVGAARAAVETLENAARQAETGVQSAAMLEAREASRVRYRRLIDLAKRDLARAIQAESAARRKHEVAHQQAEVMRRLASTRREEHRVELARIETREADETNTLMYVHRR
jgi:hypothetical protein